VYQQEEQQDAENPFLDPPFSRITRGGGSQNEEKEHHK
jgi:hypothetical protein